jgi:hypothetical protein
MSLQMPIGQKWKEKMPLIIDPDPTLQNNLMAFGRECDSGWNKLIDELIEKLNKLPEEIHVLQIKEKWGLLRFYIDTYSLESTALIDEYETISGKTCEICGKKGRVKDIGGRWYKTVCLKHYCVIAFNHMTRYIWYKIKRVFR